MRGGYRIYLVAAGLIAAATGAWAQSAANQGAEQNVRQSQQYEALLCSNPAFRAKRIAQECGPLQGSQFYAGCLASFQCGAARAPHWRQTPPSEMIR
jgi:hypothetical protein